MKIKPVFTEKSTADAKKGKYTFWVEAGAGKRQIKSEIGQIFNVDVRKVRTLKISGGKKAIVELKEGQKLDIYEKPKKNS